MPLEIISNHDEGWSGDKTAKQQYVSKTVKHIEKRSHRDLFWFRFLVSYPTYLETEQNPFNLIIVLINHPSPDVFCVCEQFNELLLASGF